MSVDYGPYVAASARKFNFMVLRIDGQTLAARALTPEGEQLDAFRIAKAAGRPDAEYLAHALPETGFDTTRNLIYPHLRGIRLRELPQPGRPVNVSLRLGAGGQAMKFRLRLDGGGHYRMDPVEGASLANGTTVVNAAIRARGVTEVKRNALVPAVRFWLEYEINGQKGSILGGDLRYDPAAAAVQPEFVRPMDDEDEY